MFGVERHVGKIGRTFVQDMLRASTGWQVVASNHLYTYYFCPGIREEMEW